MVAGADRGRGDALEGRSGSKVAKARARARKIENEAKAARARLKRAQTAENTVKELRGQLDEAMEVEEPPASPTASEDEPEAKLARRGDGAPRGGWHFGPR